MTELYPIISRNGKLVGVVGSGGDVTVVEEAESSARTWLYWVTRREALDVTGFIDRRKLWIDGTMVPAASWVEAAPYVHAYVAWDLEEYVDWLAKRCRGLEGRRVLLNYSGGKDSTAALVVLLKLMERISFRLRVVYVHVPFLEPERNVSFVEHASRRLGVDVEIAEPPRREFKSMLQWKGLPRRDNRWCTYFKVKPVREIRKKDRRLVEVVGDRLFEAPKRMERLARRAAQGIVLSERRFTPTAMLTLLDVVKVVRSAGLIHPDYLQGLPRVSCTLCPYKALHEFTDQQLDELEDPGLIERVLSKEHRKWYEKIPFNEFVEKQLWRYPVWLAVRAYNAAKSIEYSIQDPDPLRLSSDEAASLYRSVWVNPLPRAPRLTPEQAASKALRGVRQCTLLASFQ